MANDLLDQLAQSYVNAIVTGQREPNYLNVPYYLRPPAEALNQNALTEGTISNASWLDFNPMARSALDTFMEASGAAPSARIVDRLVKLQSPVLRPQSAYEWADWGAGAAADTIQTGLAGADLAALAPHIGRRAANSLMNELGQVDVWHGSPKMTWEDKVLKDVDEGWFVHGRAGTKDLMSEFKKHEIFVSKEPEIADFYAGDKGSIWQLKPKQNAKMLDASNDGDINNIVAKLFRDYNRGNLEYDLSQMIENDVKEYGAKKAFQRFKEILNPKDIVEDEGLYSNTDFVNWLYENFGYDFVKTNRGGVAYNPDAFDIRSVSREK